jgi:hypothetical protein
MRNATPGTTIYLAPGVYVGIKSSSGDPDSRGCFYTRKSGTSSDPIVIRSCDPAHPAVLSGSSVSDGSYVLHLTGDWWEVRDVVVTNGQKGVMIDHGNHNLSRASTCTASATKACTSATAARTTTSRTRGSTTPATTSRASARARTWDPTTPPPTSTHVIGNVIHDTRFDGDITAEHVDIKEGADGTVVEFCTFDATGITGSNSGDCFIDAKGVNSVIRNNRGDRKRNSKLSDAFQVSAHGSGYPTGKNNRFYQNTVNLDDCSGYVVNAGSGTANTTAHDDVRIGGGRLYTANVTVTPTLGGGGRRRSSRSASSSCRIRWRAAYGLPVTWIARARESSRSSTWPAGGSRTSRAGAFSPDATCSTGMGAAPAASAPAAGSIS